MRDVSQGGHFIIGEKQMEHKLPTTYDRQMEILRSRGITIDDEAFCKQVLADVNYYRMTAYFLPFKQADGNYVSGTSFRRVYRIYEFDRKLRGILFGAVEQVEVFLRARFAYYHAHKYGAEGYLDPANFNDRHQADKFKENFEREVSSNSKALFVKHHIENYDGHFPVWVATELFSFGMLSRFYSDMLTTDQKTLARDLYGTTYKNLQSWLRCCTDLRNICAHYGRLYYRVFTALPAGINIPDGQKRRLWGAVLALNAVYPDANKWNTEILPELAALFEEYANDIDLYHLAFPKNWEMLLHK